MFRSLALPAFCLLWAGTVPGVDWPQWRGPNRDGVWSETGVLESFPPEGLKINWRVPAGYGFSSPVVARGRVCLSDSQLNSPNVEARVRCFDENTGALLWAFSQNMRFPDWAFVRGQELRAQMGLPFCVTTGFMPPAQTAASYSVWTPPAARCSGKRTWQRIIRSTQRPRSAPRLYCMKIA